MYVNDLESHLYSADGGVTISDFELMLLLYADDLVIFAETPEVLQLQIDKLYSYCQQWNLLINTEKSKIVVFRKGTRTSQERWLYGETWWRHQMETFSALLAICAGNSPVPGEFPTQRPVRRSFDVFFDPRSNKRLSKQWRGWWFQTQSCPLWHHRNARIGFLLQWLIFQNPIHIGWSTEQNNFQLHKILLRFKSIILSAALDLFDKLITPILCYGCEVWGFHSAPDIERVHLSFRRRIMCVKKSSQNAFVYGLFGRFPLELNRLCRIMSYGLKIVAGCKPMYVSHLHQASLSRLDNTASQNWAR